MARRLVPLLVLSLAVGLAACREQGDVEVRSLTLRGVHAVSEAELTEVLKTKPSSRFPWGTKRFFDRRAFEQDLQRIRAYYADRGYPDARVTSFDTKLNDKQDAIDITIEISEGEPIQVAEVALEGFDVLDERTRHQLEQGLPLQPGRPLDRQLAVQARERALNALRDAGYAYAQVTTGEEAVGPRRERLILRATPGPVTYFGPVELTGNASVGDEVILRQLTYKPGDRFARAKMRDSQRNLYQLEVFEFANIEALENREQQTIKIPTRVVVAESKHRKVLFGVGYGTEEQARVRVRWDHVNFFGNARHAGIEGKWSSLDRGVRADFREPYLFSQHFSLGLEGRGWQQSEPAFSSNTLGARATLRHRPNPRNEWSISFGSEYQRSRISNEALEDLSLRNELIALGLDPRTGQQQGTLAGVAFDISHRTTDNLLDARSGYMVAAHLEQAGRFLWGNYNFTSFVLEGRHYVPVSNRFVIANKLRIGSIDPKGDIDANVPFYRRFFLGGASSVRGWGRYELSPLSGAGLPIGGLSMVEGSSELRFPLWGKVGGVAFLDYGNVWANGLDFNLRDLKFAAGPGLRYLTPVGPVRVDFGYQLTPTPELLVNGEPQKRQWRLHFSIGQAF